MKVVHNKKFPLGRRFYAINICGIVFAKGELDATSARHEYIHTKQQREMLYLFFYLWYVMEWLIRSLYYRNAYKGYRRISFEEEAYRHQEDLHYLHKRRPYAWLKYLLQGKKER